MPTRESTRRHGANWKGNFSGTSDAWADGNVVGEREAAIVTPPTVERTSRAGFSSRIVIALLTFYKRWISPLLPPACRFYPTCSEYAMQAVHRHGVFRGGRLAAWRLLRCNPFTRGGYDPVPEKEDLGRS